MNAVIKQLQDEDKAQLEVDERRYAELLENDKPAPAEIDELRQLMKRLNKTSEQLQIDHRIILDAQAAENRIRRGTSLDDQIEAMGKESTAFFEETQAIIKDRERRQREIGVKHSELQATRSGAQDSHYNLEKMKHRHPELLRHRVTLPKP
jgi:hypothetical protein